MPAINLSFWEDRNKFGPPYSPYYINIWDSSPNFTKTSKVLKYIGCSQHAVCLKNLEKSTMILQNKKVCLHNSIFLGFFSCVISCYQHTVRRDIKEGKILAEREERSMIRWTSFLNSWPTFTPVQYGQREFNFKIHLLSASVSSVRFGYHISANTFHENYYFLNLEIFRNFK